VGRGEVVANISDSNVGTLPRQQVSYSPTKATRSASDKSDFVIKLTHRLLLTIKKSSSYHPLKT
jgi:hypothetical protein